MSKEQIQKIDRELREAGIRELVEDFSNAVAGYNMRSYGEYSMAWQLGVYQSVLMQMLGDNAKLRKQLKKRTKDINTYSTD
mgnify:FL=1